MWVAASTSIAKPLVCAISPLLGSLLGMLIARIVLGVAEGPLFSLKTRFINDNFAADEIGKPKAVRAVASACGANKLAIVIPCHRVIRGDGALSGYRWGIARKAQLLQRETTGEET